MFQFPRFPLVGLCVQPPVTGSAPAGFPHSDIAGSVPAHGSPTLFAVYHVLLRLLTPRHPPFAFFRFALSCGDRACLVLATTPEGLPHGDICARWCFATPPYDAREFICVATGCLPTMPAFADMVLVFVGNPVAWPGRLAFNNLLLKADALFCYSLGKVQGKLPSQLAGELLCNSFPLCSCREPAQRPGKGGKLPSSNLRGNCWAAPGHSPALSRFLVLCAALLPSGPDSTRTSDLPLIRGML
jgi:hypothetical protein